jgi:hypothetical protein
VLDGVHQYADGDVRVTGERDGDVAMHLVRLVEPEARRVGLPQSDAPRIIVAVRSALNERLASRPFDPPDTAEAQLADALTPEPPPSQTAVVEPLSIERQANELRSQLAALGRWWARFGSSSAVHFNADVNRAGGIGAGGRDDAEVERLRRALDHARRIVGRHCDEHGLARPRVMRERD